MEEHERRATQVIGSEARDAPRDQSGHMLHEQLVLLQVGENRKRVREKSDALGAAVTQCKFLKMLTWTRSPSRAPCSELGILEGTTERPVAK